MASIVSQEFVASLLRGLAENDKRNRISKAALPISTKKSASDGPGWTPPFPPGLSSVHSSLRNVSVRAKGFGTPRGSKQAEDSLRSTVQIDKFIDKLRYADDNELPLLVAENVLAFDQTFWLRLATRADTAASADDREDYAELAGTLMTMVEKVVKKTQADMDSTSDELAELLIRAQVAPATSASSNSASPAVVQQELQWPPSDPQALIRLKEEIEAMDRRGEVSERFLASLTAQLRQAAERGERPGLVAMLQTVLQMFAAARFSRQSFALRSDGSVDAAEALLEALLAAPEPQWEALLRSGLTLGGGGVPAGAMEEAVGKRIERLLLRTESGSYEQRILGEYLKEIEARVQQVVAAFKSVPSE